MKKFVGPMVLVTKDGDMFMLDVHTFALSDDDNFFMEGAALSHTKGKVRIDIEDPKVIISKEVRQ